MTTLSAVARRARWWNHARVRRIGAYVFAGIVVALVTGPGGSEGHYSNGLRHGLLAPRVIPFIVGGLVVWAAVELGGRQLYRVRPLVTTVVSGSQRRWQSPVVRLVSYGLLLVVAIVYPMHISEFWRVVAANEIAIYVLLAIGLNVVIGFAGLLDLGYIAFFAIGAYATAYFTGRLPIHAPFTLNPFLVIPLAIGLALISGVILGFPTLRLRGDYLAIVTLGFGEIVYEFAKNQQGITTGSAGVFNIPHFSIHLLDINYDWGLPSLPYYYVSLGFIVVVMFLFSRLENSRVGRAWTAIREDEVAAAATGVATLKYKLMAFAIGASTSGLAGVLFASKVGSITPDAFTLQYSILVLVLVIFGGMGSIAGVALGAAVLTWLPELLRTHVNPQNRFIYFGMLIIIMMIFRPQGLLPSRRRAREIRFAEAGLEGADALGPTPGSGLTS
jgi:branched-chain amino acid transport system permease protein